MPKQVLDPQTTILSGSTPKTFGQPTLNAYLILLGAQLAVGSAAIFARFALHGAGPVVVSALRLAIAAIPLLINSWSLSRKLSISIKHELIFALSGLALAIHFSSWIGSLLYTSVAVSTLLVSTTPVWTALYDVFVLKQHANKKFWLSLLGGACGVALIASAKSSVAPIAGLTWLGDLLAIAGGIALAAYLIAIRPISNLYPTLVIVGRTYSWSALALILTSLYLHQMPPENDLISWGGIIAMAIISQMLGHTGLNASLRWFSSSIVAFSTLLEPVFAAVLAAMIFAENLSAQTVSGCAIVLISLAVILKAQGTK
jgi:drug/metabolite transporter (DMT)-like permease